MSHANGQCQFTDGVVLHFEYNGTSDRCIPVLWPTRAEMVEHWREGEWAECSCGGDEPVQLACDYANGKSWPGRACRQCKAITFDSQAEWDDEWEQYEQDGLPSWWVT